MAFISLFLICWGHFSTCAVFHIAHPTMHIFIMQPNKCDVAPQCNILSALKFTSILTKVPFSQNVSVKISMRLMTNISSKISLWQRVPVLWRTPSRFLMSLLSYFQKSSECGTCWRSVVFRF